MEQVRTAREAGFWTIASQLSRSDAGSARNWTESLSEIWFGLEMAALDAETSTTAFERRYAHAMPDFSRAEFAEKLNQARITRGLSIRAVAKTAGVPAATAQGWLSGRHFPVAALRPQYLQMVEQLGLSGQIPEDLWGEGWSCLQPTLRDARSPYLGLRPFGVRDAELFYGRAAESQRLAQAVLAQRDSVGHGIVALVGPSGSGKSSLLAAGLLAHECAEGLLAGWQAQLVNAADDLDLATELDLIVVDQFEDVLLADPDQRDQVLARLGEAARRSVVVIGLRSDAFTEAIQEPLLAEPLSRPVLLAPLTRAELREIITAPAELVNVSVDEALVRALELDLAPGATDSSIAADVLPLLSNALLVTWAAGNGQRMSLADYEVAGGAAAAVESLAEEVFGSLSIEQQESANVLFLRMVRLVGESVVREPLPLASVDAEQRPIMDAFVAARMLTVAEDRVRISHDALIAHWSRLKDWVEQSRNDLEVLASVRRAAQVWIDSERDDGALIPVRRLAFFAEWLADSDRQRLLSATEREFLAASEAHYESVLQTERKTSARLRRRGRLALSMAAATTALALTAGVLYFQAQSARSEAQSRQVATTSRSLRAKDPNLLTQMSAVSVALANTQASTSAVVDATSSDAPLRWAGPGSAVLATLTSAGLVARGGGEGQVTLWRGDELTTSPGKDFEVDPSRSVITAVALRQVGDRALLAVGSGKVRALWDVTAEPRLVTSLKEDDLAAYSAAFSPDGSRLLFGTESGEVMVWDLTNPDGPMQTESLKLEPSVDEAGKSSPTVVTALALGGDGVAYVGGIAGQIARWKLGQGKPQRLANLSNRYIPTGGTQGADVRSLALALSPDGKLLAAGQAGRAVLTWKLRNGEATNMAVLRGFGSFVNAVSYSDDSTRLIAGSSDQEVSIYEAGTGTELRRMTTPAIVTGAGFLAGRPVAGATDGMLRVWPAHSPVLRSAGAPASYNLATNATSNGWLAVGNNYSPMNLWRSSNGSLTQLPDPAVTLPEGDAQKGCVAVSPAGDYLIGATERGRMISWPLTDSGAGKPFVVETGLGYIGGAKISPNGKLISAAESEGTRAVILRVGAGGRLSVAARIPALNALSTNFNADSSVLAIALAGGRVELWSVADPSEPKIVGAIDQLSSGPTTLAASTTAPLLAVGQESGVVSLWDLTDPAKPTKAREFGDPTSYVYSVDFSPNGQQLVATSGDDLVWSWDLTSKSDQAIFVLDGDLDRPWDARFIDNGQRLSVTGNNGEIKLWTATPTQAKTQVCANRGEPITTEEWRRYLPGVDPIQAC